MIENSRLKNIDITRFREYSYRRNRRLPNVSIRPHGCMYFSAKAVKEYRLGRFCFAKLYFNPEDKVIVVYLSDIEDLNGMTKIKKNKIDFRIVVGDFLSSFGIKVTQSLAYPTEWIEEKKWLAVDLTR